MQVARIARRLDLKMLRDGTKAEGTRREQRTAAAGGDRSRAARRTERKHAYTPCTPHLTVGGSVVATFQRASRRRWARLKYSSALTVSTSKVSMIKQTAIIVPTAASEELSPRYLRAISSPPSGLVLMSS